ncbi:hypothetical protein KI387_037187 [Taxus chinensis]|uniref:U-box domain-containing protein 12 n=1 Tax=Taxus chinensis TaxID=29808 RepID=A0AA38KWE4_TAXCH|nr:hypothetical protein KI387_037187 [Taxus chinensis]
MEDRLRASRPGNLNLPVRLNMPAMAETQAVPANISPTSLVQSLIQQSRDIASMEKPKMFQIHNVMTITRRIKLLSVLFEEIKDTGIPLPPSAILCLKELSITIQRIKLVIETCKKRSCIWNLMENESMSLHLHELTAEIVKALDFLPLRLLDVTDDIREQVDLVHKQAQKAKPFVDPEDERLRRELIEHMKRFEERRSPEMYRLGRMLQRLGFKSPGDYQAELGKLEDEVSVQAGTGGVVVVSTLNNLIAMLLYAKCVLFGVVQEEEGDLAPCSPSFNEASTSGFSDGAQTFTVPDEFKCPISLDLMKDPVIVATGHTYDRASISQWLESGHCTCPKSGQKLLHLGLIPNFALRSLIAQWCEDNGVPFELNPEKAGRKPGKDHISSSQAAIEAIKMTAAFLVGKLATGSPDIQRQAAFELRLLAKSGMENRRCIAEAGAIPFLVSLLQSKDARTQENAVTALLNLSIYDNNRTLIMAAGALDFIIEVLHKGKSMESRENAAATLFSLSVIDDCKITIGTRPKAIPALVSLLKEGTSRGKRDAATALFNLSLYNGNKPLVVAAGAIPVLVELLLDERAGITDDALAVLSILAGSVEGLRAIGSTSALPVLVELLRLGSPKGKENSIAVLLAVCKSGGEDMVNRLLMISSTLHCLQSLAMTGSARAKRKATSLLKILSQYEKKVAVVNLL